MEIIPLGHFLVPPIPFFENNRKEEFDGNNKTYLSIKTWNSTEFLARSDSADTQGEKATFSNIQFEFGSTAHDYEPWTGVTKLDDTFTTDGKQVYYSSDPDVGYCFFTFI